MRQSDDSVLLCLAVAVALGASAGAVRQHDDCTAAGYALAAAERENATLARLALRADQRVAALRSPALTLARRTSMQLGRLDYPKHWNVVAAPPERRP